MTTTTWTPARLAQEKTNPPLTTNTVRRLIEKGTIPGHKNNAGHWAIHDTDAQHFLTSWENTWSQTQGKKSPYITAEEVKQRWGISPALILHGRRNHAEIDKTDIYGETVWNRRQFEHIATERGYLDGDAKIAGLDHCLHGTCKRLAQQQPEGYGFRFCPEHLPNWEKVRDMPQKPRTITTAAENHAA